MIKAITAGIAAAGIAVTVFALPASASTTPPSWTQRTCSAFSKWQDKPTTAHLDAVVVASMHLPHGYLAADVGELYADSVTAKPKEQYISVAAQYVAEDCWGGA